MVVYQSMNPHLVIVGTSGQNMDNIIKPIIPIKSPTDLPIAIRVTKEGLLNILLSIHFKFLLRLTIILTFNQQITLDLYQ